MKRRTTVELDDELLIRAQRALGGQTVRGTIEEALRRVSETAEAQREQRAERQRGYLERLSRRVDLAVLRSEEMWR